MKTATLAKPSAPAPPKKVVLFKTAGTPNPNGSSTLERIQTQARLTFNEQVLSDVGHFGGLFEFNAKDYKKPVLVVSSDGAGTKIQIALAMGKHKSLGHDIVSHCVNDILAQGAKPLFFMDHIMAGKLNPTVVEEMVTGMADECKRAGAALIGGKATEMPWVYREGDYDIAGTIVGAVDKKRIVRGEGVKPGDVCIGLPSVSLHTNGYSLARKIVTETAGLKYNERVPELNGRIGDILLIPHKSYFKEVHPVLEEVNVKAMAHITAGGLLGNPSRMLPEGCRLRLKEGSWKVLPIFDWLVKTGNVPKEEAYRTFNMGLGFLLIVSAKKAEKALRKLQKNGATPAVVGEVVQGARGVEFA
jgi:phosphoribosylformylglycinamidine cyclo-ligase